MSKIYVLKGSFDPFTLKDRSIALQYLHQHSVKKIFFDVTKEGKRDYKDRIEILKRTIAPYRKLALFTDELKDKEIVYIEDEQAAKGITTNDFTELSDSASQYIIEKGLYFEDIIDSVLSKYRGYHVKCVASLAASLAKHYGLSYYEGLVAGYLHDITKEWDKEKQRRITAIYRPDKQHESIQIFHQFTAKIEAQTSFKIRNKMILDAIGNHVNGTDRKLLSKIVFCSDKIDDSRDFDNTKQKAECFKDIHKAFIQIQDEQRAYLKANHKI